MAQVGTIGRAFAPELSSRMLKVSTQGGHLLTPRHRRHRGAQAALSVPAGALGASDGSGTSSGVLADQALAARRATGFRARRNILELEDVGLAKGFARGSGGAGGFVSEKKASVSLAEDFEEDEYDGTIFAFDEDALGGCWAPPPTPQGGALDSAGPSPNGSVSSCGRARCLEAGPVPDDEEDDDDGSLGGLSLEVLFFREEL